MTTKYDIYLPEIIFEFVIHGNFAKVMAVDPETGTEIAIVGDARSTRATLEKVATNKLKMVLSQKQSERKISNRKENLY